MPKILLISFFSSSNIGDNAIAEILKKELSSFADVRVMDISGRKPALSSTEKGNVDRGIRFAPKCRFYELKSILSLRKWNRFSYSKKLISQSDLILLAGGNMIMDLERFSYYSYLCQRYVKRARSLGKKVAFAFVGVGCIRTWVQRLRWRRVLEAANLVSVRDALARQLLMEGVGCQRDILVWKDPVFLLEPRATQTPRQAVGINIYLGAAASPEQRVALKEAYLLWIHELSRENDVVLYTTEHIDEAGLDEVFNAVVDKSRVSWGCPQNLEELLRLYQGLSIAITTRMHAFIIAATQGIPTLMLSWDKKIDGVALDVGMASQVYGIHSVARQREEILEAARSLIARREEYAARTEATCRNIRQEFREYIQTLKELTEEA